MPPLHERLAAATDTLASAGVPDPGRDARALALHVLDLRDPAQLQGVDLLGAQHASAFDELVARRAAREPLEHLTGRVRFRGVELAVGPGVFVPQPETEPLVAWAVDAITAMAVPRPRVVDLCTGAGTVAFALANELPHAEIHAVERDPGAFRWTQRNRDLRRAAGDTEVQLHLDDVDTCLPETGGRFDLVVSNPPYVATTERHVPEPEVVEHDPSIALWAGKDGLDVIRLVERTARRLLRPGGVVAVEHSDRQGRSAPEVLRDAGGWAEVTDHVDQLGRDRFVTGCWTGA